MTRSDLKDPIERELSFAKGYAERGYVRPMEATIKVLEQMAETSGRDLAKTVQEIERIGYANAARSYHVLSERAKHCAELFPYVEAPSFIAISSGAHAWKRMASDLYDKAIKFLSKAKERS